VFFTARSFGQGRTSKAALPQNTGGEQLAEEGAQAIGPLPDKWRGKATNLAADGLARLLPVTACVSPFSAENSTL
jgi:hypothetical protein